MWSHRRLQSVQNAAARLVTDARRPHNSDFATTTLAARATARTVQDRWPRLSMSNV